MMLWTSVALAGPADDGAVVIGVEDYFIVPDAAGATAEADAFVAFLEGRGVPSHRIEKLADKTKTSREKMLAAAKRLGEETSSSGIAWVYFTGNGAPSPGNGERLLLGADVPPDGEVFAARGVPVRELVALAGAGGARVMLIVDARFDQMARDGQPLLPTRFSVPTYAVQTADKTADWTLPGGTKALLTGLGGAADADGDGRITLKEAHAHVDGGGTTLVAGDRSWELARAGADGGGEPIVLDVIEAISQQSVQQKIMSTLRKHRSRIGQCAEQARQRTPNLMAKVTLRIRAQPDGRTWARVAQSSGDRALDGCVLSAVKSVRWPESRQGSPQFTFPFVLR